MDYAMTDLQDRLIVEDWDSMRDLFDKVLGTEGVLADFYTRAFWQLAQKARDAQKKETVYTDARRTVPSLLRDVKRVRNKLIKLQAGFIDSL
jgi:hypothetical protein